MYRNRLFVQTSIALFTLAGILLGSSCEKATDTGAEDGLISYTIDWKNALSGCATPRTVRYCIYPSGNRAMIQMEGEASSFKLVLPPDTYRLLLFNTDAQGIDFRNLNTFETAEAYINMATKAGTTGQLGITPLYGLVLDSLTVAEGENAKVSLTPIPLVQNVALHISVTGMEYVKDCRINLSGIASSLNLSRQIVVPNKPMTVAFDTHCSEQGISANALILGVATSEGDNPDPIKNLLTLDLEMKDGTTVTSTAELGDQLAGINTPDIKVDIDATVTQGATFTVALNHWEVAPGDGLTIE